MAKKVLTTRKRWAILASLLGIIALVVSLIAVPGLEARPTRRAATVPNFAYLRAQINAAKAVPKFFVPGPPIDVSSLKGKTVYNIPSTTQVPFQQLMDAGEKAAADLVGVKFHEYTNQGQVSQWVQGINTAIAAHADLILLPGGIDPLVLQPQLKAAKRAGIPVVVAHYNTEGAPVPPNVNAAVFAPYNRAARLVADWAILDTKGHADVAIITSNEIKPAKGIVNSMQTELAKYCGPGCKAKVINVPFTAWATKIQTEVQSAITANPNLNYILPIFDSMSQFVVPGILAAGASKRVHTASYNGTPFVLKMLQTGDIVRMNVGEDINWIGWANMDQAFRIMLHKPAGNERTPVRVWVKSNVNATGIPPKNGVGYGGAYVAGFKKLWGLSK